MNSRRPNPVLEVASIVGALVGCAVLFYVFGAAAGVFLAGGALSIAIGRVWLLRKPLRWRGSEIKHLENPFGYHFSAAALFFFACLILVAGVLAAL